MSKIIAYDLLETKPKEIEEEKKSLMETQKGTKNIIKVKPFHFNSMSSSCHELHSENKEQRKLINECTFCGLSSCLHHQLFYFINLITICRSALSTVEESPDIQCRLNKYLLTAKREQ